MYLETIQSPQDVKALTIAQLRLLSEEVRQTLLTKLSQHGGHIGPNLGMVELTIAMHYVFDSPKDKFVYDVSHQSYTHKILTGRKEAFLSVEHYDDVSGYSNPEESEHDFFTIGHTSTSISLACGLAKARDLKQDNENIIALIGDGSLSGGEAYEGLNNAVEAGTNLIIIVNDNAMSIAENAGGLYQNLRQLRETKGTYENNFFTSLGFMYHYVEDGHNLSDLITTLQQVKDINKPVIVHVHTVKGKGYSFAEEDQEPWHAGGPFDLATGERATMPEAATYDQITTQFVEKAIQEQDNVVALTSGTPGIYGFSSATRKAFGKQFVDVGIAEEHAMAMASGIAKNGGKAIYAVYSTFLQRTYDQISHDLCLNNNPAVVLVYLASIYGLNDKTHLGIYDIGMLSNIPNLVYLAPTHKEEYEAMLAWSLKQRSHPVFIRVPSVPLQSNGKVDTTNYDIINKYSLTKQGEKVAIIALGNFYTLGEEVVAMLKESSAVDATLINPKFITGLDEELLTSLLQNHSLVITLEDGILEGGFGEKIARFYGPTNMKVKNYGIKKGFPNLYEPATLLMENGMTTQQIVQDITNLIK